MPYISNFHHTLLIITKQSLKTYSAKFKGSIKQTNKWRHIQLSLRGNAIRDVKHGAKQGKKNSKNGDQLH